MAPSERSEEVWLWYTAVYEAIQEIPRGRVTSYGHIARLVGKRESLHLCDHAFSSIAADHFYFKLSSRMSEVVLHEYHVANV